MHLTTADLRLIAEALDQLDLEYGRSDASELADRVLDELRRREETR